MASSTNQPSDHAAPHVPDYECIRKVGAGAYGDVWVARTHTGSLKALKFLYRDRFDSEDPYDREYRGIQKYEGVARQHTALIDIQHVGRHGDDGFYYVMPLADDISGDRPDSIDAYAPRTVSSLLKSGPLPVEEATRIAIELLRGLEVLHRNKLAHRDIKPGNIVFIDAKPVLADVGLVSEVHPELSNLGTHGFMAPEGPGESGDVYALGRTLYVMVGGAAASTGLTPPTLTSQKARKGFAKLNKVLLKACSGRPAQRHASAAKFRRALERAANGKSTTRSTQAKARKATPPKTEAKRKPTPKATTKKTTKARTKKPAYTFKSRQNMRKQARQLVDDMVVERRKGRSCATQHLTSTQIKEILTATKSFFWGVTGRVPQEILRACWWAEAVFEDDAQTRRELVQKASKGNKGGWLEKPAKYSNSPTAIVSPFQLIKSTTRKLSRVVYIRHLAIQLGRIQSDEDAATRVALDYLLKGIDEAIPDAWRRYRNRRKR